MKSSTSMKNIGKLVFLASQQDWCSYVTQKLFQLANKCIESNGVFNMAVSGGNTPIIIFNSIIENKEFKNWEKINIFWVDERCVSITDPSSNFGNAYEILNKRGIKMFPMFSDEYSNNVELAASKYSIDLELLDKKNDLPCFDLILLGMGDDGHTASLFPDTEALIEQIKTVTTNYVPKLDANRITLTFPVLKNAKSTFILINGKTKIDLLRNIIGSKKHYPIESLLDAESDITWMYYE